jgi:sugar phosphate isomerase/epimerase
VTQRIDRRQWVTEAALAGAGLALGGAARAAWASPGSPPTGRLHLGIVTYNVARDWDLEAILKIVREAGLEGVELRTSHAHGIEPGIGAERRREVRERCRDAGLLQVSLGSVCEFQSPDPAVVKQNIASCREFVLLARDIGARAVKVRPNGLPDGVPVEKTLEQIGKALAECGRYAADAGVEIWMEVHGKGTQEPAHSQRIMEHCGHPSVGVTWNSNPTDVANGSLRDAFGRLGRYIRCCHIHELWDDYPYRELFSLLAASGSERFALCEIPQSIRAEDGATFLKCYRGLWRELQR